MQYDLEQFKADRDWQCAFYEAVHGTCLGYGETSPIAEVAEVIAASEGEKDEADWICVCRMNDGRFAVMRAGCDYTGWDCQASGKIEYYGTLAEAVSKLTLTAQEIERLRPDIEERGIAVDW